MIELWNDAARTWGGFIVPALVQNTVFLVIVLVALRAMRRFPARVRHAIALVGVVKLLTPPFLRGPAVTDRLVEWSAVGDAGGAIPFVTGTAAASTPVLPALTVTGILFAIWAAIAVFRLAAFGASAFRLGRLLRDASPVAPVTVEGVRVPRGIRILRSDRIAVPLTFGLRPSAIIVPVA